MGLAPVVGFLDHLGIDILAPSFGDVVDLVQNRFETTVATDPFRVTVTIQSEAGMLSVSLDHEMTVVDVHRQQPAGGTE